MKQKVGELYGKPIVVGNPNEFEKYEIPLKDLGGNSFDGGMEYYLVLNNQKYKYYADSAERFTYAFHKIINLEGRNYIGVIYGYDINNDNVIAFCTSRMQFSSHREGNNNMIQKFELDNNVSLSDTSKFKQITAKEYYSLLK